MEKQQKDCCCEIDVKGPCITCDFSSFCNGKWRQTTK